MDKRKVTVGPYTIDFANSLGHGTFAEVFLGTDDKGQEYAIKRIHRSRLSKPANRKLLKSEIDILRILDHRNIVKLIEIVEEGDYTNLVMEYCNGGDLMTFISGAAPLDELRIGFIAVSIADGLKYMRERQLMHRDLKPQNILLHFPGNNKSALPQIKLADFGFARYLEQDMAATFCGSPLYMAPEVLDGNSYDASADLWSVGTILYQCLTGKTPFRANSIHALQQLLKETHGRIDFPKSCSEDLRALIAQLLQIDPKLRISFDDFFRHPFLEKSRELLSVLPASPAEPAASSFEPKAEQDSLMTASMQDLSSSSFVLLDKENVALQVTFHNVKNIKAASKLTEEETLRFLALVNSLLEPANEVMVAAKDTLKFGASALSSSSLSQHDSTALRSPNTLAEAHVLFTKALTLFKEGAQQLTMEIDANPAYLLSPEVKEKALYFRRGYDECLERLERLRHDISSSSYYASVLKQEAIMLSAEELLLEYAKRLCKDGAIQETAKNYRASEELYSRALCLFGVVAQGATTDEECLVVDHFAALARQRLNRLVALRSPKLTDRSIPTRQSSLRKSENAPPTEVLDVTISPKQHAVRWTTGDSPPSSDAEDAHDAAPSNSQQVSPYTKPATSQPMLITSTLPHAGSFGSLASIPTTSSSPSGLRIVPRMYACKCGNPVSLGQKFCNECGAALLRPS